MTNGDAGGVRDCACSSATGSTDSCSVGFGFSFKQPRRSLLG
jgi:hypothetical protein